MATLQQKTLKVRRPSKEREAQDTSDTIQDIIEAIGEGMFDPYLDILFKAFDDRIQKSQGEERTEPLIRDREEKLRPMKTEPVPVIPVEGRHYRLRGAKYANVVVMYLEMAGWADNDAKSTALVKVEAIAGNDRVTAGLAYNVPLKALEEIPEVKRVRGTTDAGLDVEEESKPTPYGHAKCRKCGDPVDYSGRGRPRAFCDSCIKNIHKR